MSGDPYFFIPLDSTGLPDPAYRPIWLGNIEQTEALRSARLDARTLGIVSMTANIQQKKTIVFGVRAREADISALRPIVTLNEQSSDYIASRLRYEVGPIPLGFDHQNVVELFKHEWVCRPLKTKAGQPEVWIVAAQVEPPRTVFSFPNGDVVLSPVSNTKRTKSTPATRKVTFFSSTASVSSAGSSTDKALEAKFTAFVKQQEAINKSVQQAVTEVKVGLETVNSKADTLAAAFEDIKDLKAIFLSKFDKLERSLKGRSRSPTGR
jgi:hypothetical protein